MRLSSEIPLSRKMELSDIGITRRLSSDGKALTVGTAKVINRKSPYLISVEWPRRSLVECLTRQKTDATVTLAISENVAENGRTTFAPRVVGVDNITGVRSMEEALYKTMDLFDEQGLIYDHKRARDYGFITVLTL